MDQTKLRELCEKAIYALSGVKATVRLQHPICSNFDGWCSYVEGIGPVVDLTPPGDEGIFFYLVCHEAAHLASGHLNRANPTPREVLDMTPNSVKMTEEETAERKVNPVKVKHESEASDLVDTFAQYGNWRARDCAPDEWLEAHLKALCTYQRPVKATEWYSVRTKDIETKIVLPKKLR